MKIQIFENDEVTASDLTRDKNVSCSQDLWHILYYCSFLLKCPSLLFFQVSTGLEIELLNDSREVDRQDLQKDIMAEKNSRKCSGFVIY